MTGRAGSTGSLDFIKMWQMLLKHYKTVTWSDMWVLSLDTTTSTTAKQRTVSSVS